MHCYASKIDWNWRLDRNAWSRYPNFHHSGNEIMKILNFLHFLGLGLGKKDLENASGLVGRSREFNAQRRELKWNYYDSYNEIVGNSAPKGNFNILIHFNYLSLNIFIYFIYSGGICISVLLRVQNILWIAWEYSTRPGITDQLLRCSNLKIGDTHRVSPLNPGKEFDITFGQVDLTVSDSPNILGKCFCHSKYEFQTLSRSESSTLVHGSLIWMNYLE